MRPAKFTGQLHRGLKREKALASRLDDEHGVHRAVVRGRHDDRAPGCRSRCRCSMMIEAAWMVGIATVLIAPLLLADLWK